MSTSDRPRKTFSAPQRYWDLLDDLVADGHAKNVSGALRYVCDFYEREQQRADLADSARQLDDGDWLSLTGLGTDLGADAGIGVETPKWSQLMADESQ